MDPSVRRDPELEGSAESSLPQPAPAGPRPRLPAHPSASEPVHHFERVQTLPHRPAARPASPEYSWAPARVASNRPDGQPRQERGCSPLRHPQQPPSPRRPSPERRPALTASAIPRATFSSAISGDAGEGVAWSSLGFGSPRAVPPASTFGWFRGTAGLAEGWRARASGAPTHVHIEVTNGPPFAADPGQVAPLRAPTLREYQPAREGRAQFRTPRQVPGFSAPRLAVGRTPGWPAAFPREAQTAPLPTRAGRDPMLTMCRVLNLAEACEVVANLQLAVCGATRSFPSSFVPPDTSRFPTPFHPPLLIPLCSPPSAPPPLLLPLLPRSLSPRSEYTPQVPPGLVTCPPSEKVQCGAMEATGNSIIVPYCTKCSDFCIFCFLQTSLSFVKPHLTPPTSHPSPTLSPLPTPSSPRL
ncbi:unnamed protein product [Closterium sp. NIES-65]|nr:unnamed protein product [Closterium sp. NIES-65]